MQRPFAFPYPDLPLTSPLSAHFHQYDDVCCERETPGLQATTSRCGDIGAKEQHRRQGWPLVTLWVEEGCGRSLRRSSSTMPRASPPPRSSTSPPKPPSQTSPYLWKGALNLQKPSCLVHRPSQKTHFPDQKQGGLRTAPTLPLRQTSYRYILAIRTRGGVTHAHFILMELPEP